MDASHKNRILVTASTLPRWNGDTIPDFVSQQVQSLSRLYPEIEFHVLAPHHAGAAKFERDGSVHIHRFQYMWPTRLQKLVYPAIMPNIRRNRWLALQVPALLLAEFLAILRLCLRIKPNVLYSHWFLPQAVSGYVVSCLLQIPHVFTSHSSDVEIMWKLPVIGSYLVRKCASQAAINIRG